MGRLRDFFKRTQKIEVDELDLMLTNGDTTVEVVATATDALQIPDFYSCVEIIANIISNLEIKLYKDNDKEVEEVIGDFRTTLLNDDTYNLMTGVQMKKAMVRDYLIHGATYVYKKGYGENTKSLHYIPNNEVSVMMDVDPIFRNAKIMIQGNMYNVNDFIICTKNTENGVEGVGIIDECNEVITQLLTNMSYTSSNMSNGGVKRGVLQSQRRLTKEAIDELKKAWNKLYANNNDCIVLNEGITYKELQQTDSEMQVTESKAALSKDICHLFGVPVNIFDNVEHEEVFNSFVKLAILPILTNFEQALNKSLLSIDEKNTYYFAFDTKQLNKGDIEKRFKAYEVALKNGFMTPSEVRYEEDLAEIDKLNFVKFSLADVLMNLDTGDIYTPNTNASVNMDSTSTLKGGDNVETGNQE